MLDHPARGMLQRLGHVLADLAQHTAVATERAFGAACTTRSRCR
jgi:hypothetical protein